MAYRRPGVYVEETLLASNPSAFPSLSRAAFVGVAGRGPTTPVLIDSWPAFLRTFGGFSGANQDLAHAVFQYFSNGGSGAWIVRATGSGAAPGTRTLNDRQGTPAPVLQVDAASTGAWGNGLYVEVTDSPISGRFNLIVRLGGSADQYIVERWTDLALDPDDGRYAPSLINSAVVGSNYIHVADLFDHTDVFVPATNIPAASLTAGGDVLATGADGAAPTGGATGQIHTAATTLTSIEGSLVVNLPGISEAALINSVIAMIEARGNMFLVIDPPAGQTPTQMITAGNSFTDSSYAAVYYPRLNVVDPSNTVPGTTRLVAPGGLVLGQYAAVDATRGTFKAPAGIGTRLNGVVAAEIKPVDTDLDNLNVAGINVIKAIPGVGYCLFGARTLKPNQVDRYISVRRTLISIRLGLAEATRFAVFEPNDETLWETIAAACERVLIDLWQEGGLRGNSAAQAFFVTCDATNNTQTSIDNGEVHIDVGVALETPAEFIVLRIGQFESGTSVNEEI